MASGSPFDVFPLFDGDCRDVFRFRYLNARVLPGKNDYLNVKISGPEAEESENLVERRREGSPQSVLLALLNLY
jgi:hypothetical protein